MKCNDCDDEGTHNVYCYKCGEYVEAADPHSDSVIYCNNCLA